jgi:small subunit ribosomal protein S21
VNGHYFLDTIGNVDLACLALRRAVGQRAANIRSKGVDDILAEIKIQEGESIENALRRFKRKVQQEDIIKDIKKHSFYMKPGDKRRAKQALARKRNRKKIRREAE